MKIYFVFFLVIASNFFAEVGTKRTSLQDTKIARTVSNEIILSRQKRYVKKKDTEKMILTQEERINFVQLHNNKRKEVEPCAANMIAMTWDFELEQMAQEWAQKCIFDHGQPDRDPMPYDTIGQNLHVKTNWYDEEKSVDKWFAEIEDYTYSTRECANVCGHYTQVAWASSSKLGCAIVYCQTMEYFEGNGCYYSVCNYAPAGNVKGKWPFIEGDWCSACPETHPDCNDKLCYENPLCGGMICSEGAMDTDLCQCPPSNNTKLKQTTTDNNPETSTLPNAQTTQSAQSTPAEQTTSEEQVHTTEDTGFSSASANLKDMTTKPATEPAKTSLTPQVAEATPDTETTKSTPDASSSKLTQMELTTQMDSSTQIYEKILTTLDDSFSTRNVRTETVKSLTEQDTNNADTTIPGATSTGHESYTTEGNKNGAGTFSTIGIILLMCIHVLYKLL